MDPHPEPQRRPARLDDLTPELAERLRYERAAPLAARQPSLPPEVRGQLERIWNALVAELALSYDGVPWRQARRPSGFEERLRRLRPLLDHAERAMVFLGTHHPVPGGRPWAHTAVAAGASGGMTAVDQLLAVGSAGAGFAAFAATAVVAELLEVYVAASARARQYERVGRSPDAALVALDLAEVWGGASLAGRSSRRRALLPALTSLTERLVRRSVTRFTKGLVLVGGVAWAAVASGRTIHQVTARPLPPVDPEEAARLARQASEDWLLADPGPDPPALPPS